MKRKTFQISVKIKTDKPVDREAIAAFVDAQLSSFCDFSIAFPEENGEIIEVEVI